ncbi:MAG: Crp/Fnr family transcriptional regulator [Oscillospiraceae bacterium]|nr:Crp/Fnr family transcriptional regulator [Oscillospiraceae bacterium]
MNQLLRIKALEGVKGQTLEELWRLGSVQEVRRHQILIHARQPVDTMYFVLSGKVIYYNLTRHGKRKIIFIFGAGTLINETITNTQHSSVYCETIEACSLFCISKANFYQLMAKDFTLAEAALREQEHKLWRMSHQLKNTMGSIYMERKLAAKLWKLARDFGIDTESGRMIDISMTITFLADLMGAPRETVSRLCKTLTDYGLIQIKKRRIYVTDPQRLSHFYKEGIIALK